MGCFMEKFLEQNKTITDIVLAILVPAGKGDSVHKNRPSHGLALNCGGQKRYVFESGEKITLQKNDLIYLPKNSNYKVETLAVGDTYAINFQLAENELFSPFSLTLQNPQNILSAYRRAVKSWNKLEGGREYLCKAALYEILYALKQETAQGYLSNTQKNILAPALSQIHEKYDKEPLNMQRLAELCGISYEYFRKLFHALYGVSPVDYVNDLKLRKVVELLQSGDYSVSDAAFCCGFNDLSYFSRFFKKRTGQSPSAYLR